MGAIPVHDHQTDDDMARWVACEECGQLEHPEFTCAQAIELVRSAALRELLSRMGPTLLSALEEAAADRVERAESYCRDCLDAVDGRCASHRGDLERAAEYRRTYDRVSGALNA